MQQCNREQSQETNNGQAKTALSNGTHRGKQDCANNSGTSNNQHHSTRSIKQASSEHIGLSHSRTQISVFGCLSGSPFLAEREAKRKPIIFWSRVNICILIYIYTYTHTCIVFVDRFAVTRTGFADSAEMELSLLSMGCSTSIPNPYAKFCPFLWLPSADCGFGFGTACCHPDALLSGMKTSRPARHAFSPTRAHRRKR